jgi:Zn-dependent protease with chaperone function
MNIKINKKENLYLGIMIAVSLFVYYGFFSAIIKNPLYLKSFGILLVYLGMFLVFNLIASIYLIGYIKGNSVKISKKQFPDVFEILEKQAHSLQLNKIPEMYVLQGNGALNAFATRFARKNFIVLYSDVFEMAYEDGKEAVSFIIGHELGHIKRKHIRFLKTILTIPAKLIPFLGSAYSRACEYTCDNIGFNLAPKGALSGLLILSAGKKLYKKINLSDFLNDKSKKGFAYWFAEKISSHPYLVKRITTINELSKEVENSENLDFTFLSAKLKDKEIQKENF